MVHDRAKVAVALPLEDDLTVERAPQSIQIVRWRGFHNSIVVAEIVRRGILTGYMKDGGKGGESTSRPFHPRLGPASRA